jgi:hypothetical protein
MQHPHQEVRAFSFIRQILLVRFVRETLHAALL